MTIREYLLSLSAYPIPMRTIEATCVKRGLSVEGEAEEYAGMDAFRLAMADIYVWLYFAPNVGQGGQSYSFTDSQREWWKKQALAIYEALGEEDELSALQSQYGYMGSKL